MGARGASRTAVLVCQGRAVAHGRLAVGRFEDPTALALLRGDERLRVERARADVPPRAWSQRMDVGLIRLQAESMAARTVAVDDAVRAAGNPQLVIVGAGLDGRAWRMPELCGVDVFEIDHPASQEAKRERVAALRPLVGSLKFVAVDLTEAPLGPALTAAGHDEAVPTTWVLEGVIPYLTRQHAAATVAAVVERSAPGSRLVVHYQVRSAQAAFGRLLARVFLRLSRREDPMANEPRRSSWTRGSMRALLDDAGLRVTDDVALVSLADELSLPARQLRTSGVAVAVVPAA
ncbi:MAG TPA: class I SAM-dependent methyltransferase [Acidimicrobiales bacterium]